MQYWAAIHTHPQAEPDVRKGLEDLGFGAFLPNYANYAKVRERLAWRYRALLPGYVLVSLSDDDGGAWRDVEAVEGVNRVLTNADKPCRIRPEEMHRIVVAHASGQHNMIAPQSRGSGGRYTKRRRRPRPGKVQRAALRNVMASVHDYRIHTVIGSHAAHG